MTFRRQREGKGKGKRSCVHVCVCLHECGVTFRRQREGKGKRSCCKTESLAVDVNCDCTIVQISTDQIL